MSVPSSEIDLVPVARKASPAIDVPDEGWTTVIRSGRGLFEMRWRQLWAYRDLILMFAQRDISTSYKQTVLGPLWFIVQPIMVTAVFSYLFGRMARFGSDNIPHYLFYMSGLVLWGFFSESVTKSSNVFVQNSNLFGKIYFPRLVVPISGVLTNGVPLLVQLSLFLAGLFFYLAKHNPFVHPNWLILFTPLVVVQLACLSLGLGCIVSALTRRFRDLAFGVKLGLQLWMFASGIVFPLSQIKQDRWLFLLNPVVPPIEFFRQAFLGSVGVPPVFLILSTCTSLFVLALGLVLFNWAEQNRHGHRLAMRRVLRAENVGKAYRLGEISRQQFFDDLRSRFTGRQAPSYDDPQLFWAVRDVSFDVFEGEIVGLLGSNGAGKSTLLKIFSQITSPTYGSVKLKGRVASLLEVGTGFHVELTGRDNIYLNGMILGMSRREVARKFDEIVAFSGIEKFIDTPVKRYSVGMRVRLAFAVAAHLDAEILLMDEVLAVGDAVFQQKCLGKIGQVSRSGRTVLFVSHDAAAIQSLCTRGVVLDKGRVAFDGTQDEAIEFYAATRAALTNDLRGRTDRTGSGEIRVVGLDLLGSDNLPLNVVRAGDEVRIALRFERSGTTLFPRLAAEIHVATHLGAPVFTQANWLTGDIFGPLPERGTLICRIPRLPLPAGHYHLNFRLKPEIRGKDVIDALECARELHVESGDFFGSGKLPQIQAGVCLVEGGWNLTTEG